VVPLVPVSGVGRLHRCCGTSLGTAAAHSFRRRAGTGMAGTARARRGHGTGTARARGAWGVCPAVSCGCALCALCASWSPWSPTTPTTFCSHLKSREVNESQGAAAPVKVTSAFWLLLAEALGQLGRAAPWPSFPFQFSLESCSLFL
jgi:hypothetical protein